MQRRLSLVLLFGGACSFAACSSSGTSSSNDDAGGGGTVGTGGGDDAGGGGIDLEAGPVSPDASDAAAATPRSCAEVRTMNGVTTDGDQLIDGDGAGPMAAFHVYCAGMADAAKTPREYVSLGAKAVNTTTYAGGGFCACPDFVRTFTKVRIDPAKLTVDITDVTFSTANRATTCDTGKTNCQGPTHSYFGNPGACVNNADAAGSAKIDLTGTDFHLATGVAFGGEGYMPAGTFTAAAGGKTASLTGGGACGWWAPAPKGSEKLQLARD